MNVQQDLLLQTKGRFIYSCKTSNTYNNNNGGGFEGSTAMQRIQLI